MRHIGPVSVLALHPSHPHPFFWPSPGSTSGPRLWARSSPQWSQSRLNPGVQREKPRRLTPVSKSSGPSQVAILMAQGPQEEGGDGCGAILHVLLTSGEAAEGQVEGTSKRASEHWNVLGTSGWIRYHEDQEICA